jgi:hypothetical protein
VIPPAEPTKHGREAVALCISTFFPRTYKRRG